jgi:Ser/Thr protein kinase RdoA (MazF antagonist)
MGPPLLSRFCRHEPSLRPQSMCVEGLMAIHPDASRPNVALHARDSVAQLTDFDAQADTLSAM